jgi:hypothetical protein
MTRTVAPPVTAGAAGAAVAVAVRSAGDGVTARAARDAVPSAIRAAIGRGRRRRRWWRGRGIEVTAHVGACIGTSADD